MPPRETAGRAGRRGQSPGGGGRRGSAGTQQMSEGVATMAMDMDMKALIARVSDGHDLTEAQAEAAMTLMMNGEASHAQMAAFLVALRVKGETVAEITGCARVMRDRATRVPHGQLQVLDVVGTGGDHAGTFNISTTAAFVAAGAGVRVAKHGNRAASSRTGSADVLEALGVRIDLTPEQAGACVDEVGIGFLFAPALHTAMKHVAPVRREIGMRTIFNIMGPLTNPALATCQVVGVPESRLCEPMARVLGNLGVEHALVVHGLDGLDEVSISAPTQVAEYKDGYVSVYRVTPEDAGLPRAPREYIRGGAPDENARIVRAVLGGEPGPRRDVVLLNAAAGLMAAGAAVDLRAGVQLAAAAIDSGQALKALDALTEKSRTYAVKVG